jgi:hypothetical protein
MERVRVEKGTGMKDVEFETREDSAGGWSLSLNRPFAGSIVGLVLDTWGKCAYSNRVSSVLDFGRL